jgi:CheY-like chemotaxis protein
MITDVVESVRPLAEGKGLTLKKEVDDSLPDFISSDPLRLKQILLNLLGNAVKFTEHGSVTLRAHAGERDGTPMMIIDVIDTGIGISSQQAEQIFDAFTQADSSVTRRFGGTGLGLTLSRKMAHALGGSLVLAKAAPNRGSMFTLEIKQQLHDSSHSFQKEPMATSHENAPAQTVAAQAAPKSYPHLGGRSVLLADDSPDNAAIVRTYLEKAGVKVALAKDGIEALERVDGENFDLILMDVQMPRLDGLSATRKLRERGVQIPIIALTAHAYPEEVERSFNAGCNEHLTKPISRNALLSSIESVLTQSPRLKESSLSE